MSSCNLFADDTSICASALSVEVAICQINKNLSRVEDWCNHYKLQLNLTKNKFLAIMSSRGDNLPESRRVAINGHVRESVHQYNKLKYLGVVIDEHLACIASTR